MKTLLTTVAFILFSLVVRAGELVNVISSNSLFDGSRYEFTLSFEELDRSPAWQADQESPPLSPKKAAEAARHFLADLTGTKIDWHLSTITLHKYSERGDPNLDKWAYKVAFVEQPKLDGSAGYDGPVQTFEVVVYLTGNVIPPHFSKWKQ